MDKETTKRMVQFFEKQLEKANKEKRLERLVEAGGANHEIRYMKSVIYDE